MHKTLAHTGVLFMDDDRWWSCCDTRATPSHICPNRRPDREGRVAEVSHADVLDE
jgi:hypothetical protein